MHNSEHVTVGLLWHSLGSGNLGVGALTESNIAIVRSAAEELGLKVTFIVLGTTDKATPAITEELKKSSHRLECHRIRIFRAPYRELVKRCDFVLDIGEGDSFADIYGFKRFFYHWVAKNIVVSLGKPLILSPQTIGPFDGFLTRLMAKQIMRRCRKIFARDQLSSDYLKSLSIKKNIEEAIDVAFCLPFESIPKEQGATKIGINVSGLLFNGGYTGNNQFGLSIDYQATIRSLIEYFTKETKSIIYLVPHVLEPDMPVEDDTAASQLLAKQYPNLRLAPKFTSPSEAKSFIAQMDYFVGARMHACIAAFSSGVAVVPMAYSRKFNGLFGTLGYLMIADCKSDNTEVVISKIKQGFHSREQLKENIASSKSLVDKRLSIYRAAIRESIEQSLSKKKY